MVNFSHDYDKRDDFDFPIVNFRYLSRNIPESPVYGFFVSQLMLGFVRNMNIFCSDDLFCFKVIEAGLFFTETSDYFSEILWSSYRPCSQI